MRHYNMLLITTTQVLFIDRLNKEHKEKNARKLDKLVKKYGPGGAL